MTVVDVYIEVIVDKNKILKGGGFLFTQTGNYFGLGGRTWEDWLLHGRNLKV